MNSNKKILIRIFLTGLMVAGLLAALTLLNTWLTGQPAADNEFLPGWNAARLWLLDGNSPYSAETALNAQQLVYQRAAKINAGEDPIHFTQPVQAIFIYAVFGYLGLPLAMGLWMTINQVLLIAAVLILIKITGAPGSVWLQAVLAGCLAASYYAVSAFATGAIYPLILFSYAVLLWAIKNGRERTTGLLMAVTSVQPGVSLLVILYVLVWSMRQEKYRVWIMYCISMVALIGVGTFLVPGWFLAWLKQLWVIPGILEWRGEAIRTIAKLAPGISEHLIIIATLLFALYLLYTWGRTDGSRFTAVLRCINLTFVVTIFVLPISAGMMQVLLFPAVIQFLQVLRARFGVRGDRIAIILVIILAIGSWPLYLLTRHGLQESHAILLPLPILLLGGFWWSNWWMLRSPDRLIHNVEDI
jgi:hypothetical protein